MLLTIFVAAMAVMLISLIGVILTQKAAGNFLEKNISKLISFAAGVFLVTALVLAQEVYHLIDSSLLSVGLIIVGYGLAWTMHILIPESHHHHNETCGKSAKKLIAGDVIHNIADGIILVPAFMTSTNLGVAVTISIITHEAIQEISEFFVLRRAGYSVQRALSVNFAVSSSILIGVAIGSMALSTTNLEGILLAITSGFFLHVVFHDLFPTRSDSTRSGSFGSHLLLVLIGAVLMFGVNVVLGEAHTHADHGNNDEYAPEGDRHSHDAHEENHHEEHDVK